jgi:hypothetical protein
MSVSGNASSSQKKPLVHKLPGLRTSPVSTTKTGSNISSTKTPTVSLNPYNSLPYVIQGETTPATSTVQNKPAKIPEGVRNAQITHNLLSAYDKTGKPLAAAPSLGQLAGLDKKAFK